MAKTSSRLNDLANALSTDERKRLYNRIVQSLSLHDERGQKIYHADLPTTRRDEIVAKDMATLGLWDRFRFWLMRLFSHRTNEEVFLRFKLNRLRDRIRSCGNALVDFDENLVLPELPARIYQFYRSVYPVMPMIRKLWHRTELLQRMISYLLEHRIPNARSELHDFMPMKEMQDLYMQTENKQSIRKEVTARLENYLLSIQADLFSGLEDGLLPLYYLKDICLFPYSEFFSKFGVDVGYEVPEKTPSFKPARVIDVEQYLEQLYFALYSARRMSATPAVHPELMTFYAKYGERNDSSSAEDLVLAERDDTEPNAQPASNIATRVTAIRSGLKELRSSVDVAHAQLPLAEVIKYFRRDPYYRFLVYMPKVNLREFYSSSLSISIFGEIEQRLEDVRMGVVGRMITSIFATEPPEFDYYRLSAFSWVKKLGISPVRYVKSLNILYNYVKLQYSGEVQEFVHGMSRIIPNRLRDIQGSMIFHAGALEELADTIHAFDESFGPDGDDAKSIARMRMSIEKDASLQRSFFILMAQKDRDARNLIDKGIEHIQGLGNAFSELLRGRDGDVGNQAASLLETRIAGQLTEQTLSHYVQRLLLLKKLLNQLIAMEEGY